MARLQAAPTRDPKPYRLDSLRLCACAPACVCGVQPCVAGASAAPVMFGVWASTVLFLCSHGPRRPQAINQRLRTYFSRAVGANMSSMSAALQS